MLKDDLIHTKTEPQVQNRKDAKDPGHGQRPQATSTGSPYLFPFILSVLLILGVLWLVYHRRAAATKTAAAAGARGPMEIPVIAGKVAQTNIPIFLDGLGTVQAFNTVTVHVRVDGQLTKVAFEEGQDVHVGDALAEIDPAPFKAALDQAIAKKGQDDAQLTNARRDMERDTDLFKDKVVSQQVFDTQKALVDQLDATVKADQAAIESAQVQLAYTTVTSPIDGRVGIRQVDVGNIVHATDSNGLVVITQLRPISVIFTLPEQNLSQIHRQMRADGNSSLTVLAVDRDNSTTLDEGSLAVIDNQIDTTTGTIKLKANFPNARLRLWPGQFVNTRLLLTTRTNAIVVPVAVIQRGPEGSYAFVIKDDQTVELRPVTVALMQSGEALVDKGLEAGESIVVDGQYRLQPGSHVKSSFGTNSPSSGGDAQGKHGHGTHSHTNNADHAQ